MINTTGDLKKVIRKAFKQSTNQETFQTYKRAFQALRISTNYELLNITKFLEECPSIMDSNSLLLVITFHSLEE